jgi:prophage tail gpP-like protein
VAEITNPFIPSAREEKMTLIVRGAAYDRWKSARVTLQMDSPFQEFQFSTSEPVDIHEDWDQWNIRTGDSCEVLVGGRPVIRGVIDMREAFYDAYQHGVMFYGRDYNCCAYESGVRMDTPSVNFVNATFTPIMSRALQGSGTSIQTVASEADSIVFPNWAIGFGETPWNVGERLKRYIPALRITSNPLQRVWMAETARLGSGGANFVEGKNILSARVLIDSRGWMPFVHVKQQRPARDEVSGQQAAEVDAKVYDNSLPVSAQDRYLPIAAEDPGTQQTAEGRGRHEIIKRGEDAVHCTIRVYTWWEQSGELYWIRKPYTVLSPMLGMDSSPLVARMVQFEQSEAGSTTTLELMSKNALSPYFEHRQPANLGARGPLTNYGGQGVPLSEIERTRR